MGREIHMRLAHFLAFVLFFAAAFAWPTWRTWRRYGVNPLVLPRDDSPAGVVAGGFRLTMLALFAGLAALAAGASPALFGPLPWLEHTAVSVAGWAMVAAALVWIVAAQALMGRSWRIGIDTRVQPPLVQTGLFARSRNPIFLGMRVALLGFFLVLPNALTLAVLAAGEVLMQMQVRLEEQHLTSSLDEEYRRYAARTPRWL